MTPEQLKRFKLTLSHAFAPRLTEPIRQREEWLEKNRAVLHAYNEHVEKHGVFSDGLRSF